jgi:hypothetical protein
MRKPWPSCTSSNSNEDVGVVLERVAQERLLGRHLRARRIAESHVAGGLGRVPVEVGVADDQPEVPAEPLAALLHALLQPVQVAGLVRCADALEHGIQMAVVVA